MVMHDLMEVEEKLEREVNGTAICVLQACGFDYSQWDLDSMCRELGVATFADFKHVSAATIAAAGLRNDINRRKMTQLCEHCCDADTYKRWRRRVLRFREISAAEVAATQRARAQEQETHARVQQWTKTAADHAALTGLLCQLRLDSRADTDARLDIGLSMGRTMTIYVRMMELDEVTENKRFVSDKRLRIGYTDSVFDELELEMAPFAEWVEVFSRAGHVVDENSATDDGLCWESEDPGGALHARDLIDRWGRQLFREQGLGDVVYVFLHVKARNV
jgi:hypothetical protein